MRLDDGSTVYGQQNIQNETVAYFHNLYKLDNPRLRVKLMGVIPRLVTDEENERLISMPEESEIKNVIFSMPNSKTPRPDGFSASFFNIFWATVGADVVDVRQDFFSSGTMPRGLNHTFIALIPQG